MMDPNLVVVQGGTWATRSTHHVLLSLVELMLDPYYRSFNGFCVLVDKHWTSFGYLPPSSSSLLFPPLPSSSLLFPPLPSSSLLFPPLPSSSLLLLIIPISHAFLSFNQTFCPVFFLFLHSVWMLQQTAISEFEFGEGLLSFFMDSTFSGRFDTFLFDNDKRRKENHVTGTSIYRYLVHNDEIRKVIPSSVSPTPSFPLLPTRFCLLPPFSLPSPSLIPPLSLPPPSAYTPYSFRKC
jgi:hypothetical protein